jgi:D-glycero-alpha-D-manno-heptose-7-phosphate kinase
MAVLASAIDKYSYITASPFPSGLFDYAIRVSYRKVELAKTLEEIEHRVYRECLRHCGIDRDIELHNVADLPTFTGLGSSSTFTVGLLHALHAFRGRSTSGMDLAYEAIHIERDCLGENVGCQDQTMAAAGGFQLVEFRALDDIRLQPVVLPAARQEELEAHMLLVFTRVLRRASDVVAGQLARIELNTQALSRIHRMAYQGLELLTGPASITEFGKLLHQAWQDKRTLSEQVSNSLVDEMYRLALENGACGGKLLGAGGGGFLLLIAPPERQAGLLKAFEGYDVIRVKLKAPASEVIFQT